MRKQGVSLVVIFLCVVMGVAVVQAADIDIVISEIMMNAVNETGNVGEWIELYNRGTDVVDLTGWQIQDNSETDTINSAVCPGSDCQMPAGACWLIAVTSPDLQAEFLNYTNPNQPSVDGANTIFLGARLGNGLANTDDQLILRNSSGTAVDCYSWNGLNTCAGLTYITGGNGIDANVDGNDGQSVTNVQGAWYDHEINASPYNCTTNTAATGPTAVSIQFIQAQVNSINRVVLAIFGLTASATLAAFMDRRRKVARSGNR
jgi:hypothetical protein